MKKRLLALVAAVAFAVLCLGLTACYVSKPASMSALVGTYELTKFTRTPKDADAEDESAKVDMIKTRGITAYLVVKDDGYGYYVYKDNDKALSAESVRIRYTMDDDDKSQVEKIRYDNGAAGSGEDSPLKGSETLGLTFSKKSKTLNYYFPAYEGILIKREFSQSVTYTKVSDADDLSYVNKKLGKTLKATEFGLKKLDGLLLCQGYVFDASPYVYFGVELNAETKKATLYYALKSDEHAQKKTDLPFTVAYEENCAVITLDGKTFTRTYNTSSPMLVPALNYVEGDNNFYLYSYFVSEEDAAKTTDEILAGILDSYAEARREQEAQTEQNVGE